MAAGTMGDVAPYTGLATRLHENGHDVAFATLDKFADLVADTDLAFRSLQIDADGERIDVDPLIGSAGEGKNLEVRPRQAQANLTRAASDFKKLTRIVRGVAEGMAVAVQQGADVVLLSHNLAPLGWQVAEGLGVPSLGAYVVPMHPTRDFPVAAAMSNLGSLGSWGNRATTRAYLGLVDGATGPLTRRAWERLGLPRTSSRRLRLGLEKRRWPVCYGFSPAVVPRPSDWREGLEIVGYWWPTPKRDWQPPEDLVAFLETGPPPVLIGFGSVVRGEAERLSKVARAALRVAGVRGVIQSGWEGLAVTDDEVITVWDVPHEWLMPQTAAAVHHAGAGTTAAAIRAGIPSIPVPSYWDQPFWARRLVGLGVSPGRLRYKDLTADDLAAAIRQAVSEPSYRERASALATQIQTEDGAGRVIDTIERIT